MYLKLIIVVLAAASFILTGCNKNQKTPNIPQECIVVNLKQENKIAFEDFFDFATFSYIQFEQNDTLVLSDDLTVKYADKLYFVYDAVIVQLYVFNDKGQLVNKIGSSGGGPCEYNRILSFNIDTTQKTIDVLTDIGNTIKTYNYTGNFVNSFTTPRTASDFAKINSKCYWLFTGFYDDSSYRLHLCDTNKVITSYLPTKAKSFDFSEQKFFGLGNKGLYRESFLPTIYEYDSTCFKPAYYIDFGKSTITEEDLSKYIDPSIFLEKINREGVYTTIQALENSSTVFIKTMYQKDDRITIYDFLINKCDGKIIKILHNKTSEELSSTLSLVHIQENGKFHFKTNPIQLINFISATSSANGFKIDPEGNTVILIVNPTY